MAEVSGAVGRLLAWQSRQLPGCGLDAAARAGWYCAGPVPVLGVAQVASTAPEEARWQTLQSWVTSAVAPGAPAAQATASCFMAPEAGWRVASVGPTKPSGITGARWQSPQAVGSPRCRLASEEWRLPG